jgi:ketosteroid isomerase-like protein
MKFKFGILLCLIVTLIISGCGGGGSKSGNKSNQVANANDSLINEVVATYCRAIKEKDYDTIVSCVVYPLTVVTDNKQLSFDTPEKFKQSIQQQLEGEKLYKYEPTLISIAYSKNNQSANALYKIKYEKIIDVGLVKTAEFNLQLQLQKTTEGWKISKIL